MHRIVWIVLGLLVPMSARAEQRYAIVIGANPGWSEDRPLRYAGHDAERVRDVLVALGGFSHDRVTLLEDPSTAEVRSSLRKLAQTVRDATEDTLVFFYYSGHADDKHLHLRGDPLSHVEIQDTLRGLPATIKLAVIDACKSGAVTRKGGRSVTEFDVSVVSPRLSGMVILTSSGADELSQESRALSGSVFTHHLVSGLRGAADDNADQEVTVSEAYHYAYSRTQADTVVSGAPQRPAFRDELSGQGELVLTHLAALRYAALRIPSGGQDRYVVLDSHQWRLIAEAHGRLDRDVVLALVPGSYSVKRVLPDRLEVATFDLAAGNEIDVARLSYRVESLSAGVVKGDANDLGPAERHDLMRAQAFGLLAEGQAVAALDVFDHLVREVPGDRLAWRGRGRALVRLADAYQRVGNQADEFRTLNDAVRSDPSLSEDPSFQIWYQRLSELEARAQNISEAKGKLEAEVRANPRVAKWFGLGGSIFSASGAITIDLTWVVHPMVFSQLGFDLLVPGVDASVALAPLTSRWSPYAAIGGHLSLRKLGVDIGSSEIPMSWNHDTQMFEENDIWGAAARIELGAQYVGTSGFTTHLGLGLILLHNSRGAAKAASWPVFHFGYLW